MAFGAGQTEGKSAGFERVALDLQRDKCIQNLASVCQTLKWEGGVCREGWGDVVQHVWGAKVSQLPVPLQSHSFSFILFFQLPSEDNWRIRILNPACFPLQEIMKGKRKPRNISGIKTQRLTRTINQQADLELRGWKIKTSLMKWNWNLPLDACPLLFCYV